MVCYILQTLVWGSAIQKHNYRDLYDKLPFFQGSNMSKLKYWDHIDDFDQVKGHPNIAFCVF